MLAEFRAFRSGAAETTDWTDAVGRAGSARRAEAADRDWAQHAGLDDRSGPDSGRARGSRTAADLIERLARLPAGHPSALRADTSGDRARAVQGETAEDRWWRGEVPEPAGRPAWHAEPAAADDRAGDAGRALRADANPEQARGGRPAQRGDADLAQAGDGSQADTDGASLAHAAHDRPGRGLPGPAGSRERPAGAVRADAIVRADGIRDGSPYQPWFVADAGLDPWFTA